MSPRTGKVSMMSSKSASASARNDRSMSIGPKPRQAPAWLPRKPASVPVPSVSEMVSGSRPVRRSGSDSGELVHVGLSGLRRAPAGRAERVCELVGELAHLDRELAALLARELVAAKRAVNRPADLL
jgi:hypothetical protein